MQFKSLFAAAVLTLAMASQPALAGRPGQSAPSPLVLGSTLCTLSDIGIGAIACAGFYEGNLNGGGVAKDTATALALNTLLGVSTYTPTNFTNLGELSGSVLSGGVVDFAQMLYGSTVVSFHVGAANGQANGVGYNATAFYQFDAGASGLNTFTFARPGLSNARLFLTGSAPIIPPPCSGLNCGSSVFGSAAVPEPAAWALMILGFGGVGTMLRRRRMALA